ncbi:MAG: hypothetical protein K2X99_10945, partial [Gemmatimonadaceae bacterium]|nr:hypothetical protein [Gemmatimonadaceae bacterium]
MSRSLRIGYLNQDFVPEVGAGPARILEMSRFWQAAGHRVTVVCGMPNRRIPGQADGELDPAYVGQLHVEERWDGITTHRAWVYTGGTQGMRAKTINNLSFLVSGTAVAARHLGPTDVLIASSPPFFPH